LYFASADKSFSTDDQSAMSFRSTGSTKSTWSAASLFILVSLVVVGVVESLFFYLHQSDLKTTNSDRYGRNSVCARIVERICTDVPAIIGFALVGMSVLLQAGITNSSSVIGGALILVVAGFLQHISNLVKILYNMVCLRLDASVIVALTLIDDEVNNQNRNENVGKISNSTNISTENNTQVRRILQYFGWTRLYIFSLVLFLAISFFTIAKATTFNYVVMNLLDGQLLYFSVAFLFSNIGFDMVYELMPFMFEKMSGDVMRFYFVVGYLIFFNANQFMYVSNLRFSASIATAG